MSVGGWVHMLGCVLAVFGSQHVIIIVSLVFKSTSSVFNRSSSVFKGTSSVFDRPSLVLEYQAIWSIWKPYLFFKKYTYKVDFDQEELLKIT